MTEAINPATVNVVEPVSVDDNAASLTVDGTVTANLAAGTNNIGDVDVLTVPAPLSTTGGGTEAASLRVTIANDSTGLLSIDDNGGSLTVDGTVTANLAAGTNNIGDVDVLTVPAPLSTTGGGTEAAALRVTVANDSTGVLSVDDNGGSLTVDGTVTANLAAGVNNIGDVDVLTVPAPLSTTGGGTEATAHRVTIANDSTGVLSVDDNGSSLTVDGTVAATMATVAATTAAWTSGTALDTAISINVTGYSTATLGINPSGSLTGGTLAIEGSDDGGTTWYAIMGANTSQANMAWSSTHGINGITAKILEVACESLTHVRVRLSVVITGAGTLNLRLQGIAGGGRVGVIVAQGSAPNLNATVVGSGTFAVQDSEKVTDNAAFTDGTTKVQPAGFIFDETAGTALTENDAAAARVDSKRAQVLVIEDATTRGQRATVSAAGAVKVDGSAVTQPVSGTVTAGNTAGDVAHDGVDSGNPVKVGTKAASALPTAVASGDRANAISDLWGRQLVSHIDPAMQVWKAVNVTTTQAGTDVWTPTTGKKIAVTYLSVASYGTTAARVILWFGDNADTTYTAGTDQVLWAGSFAPSTTVKAGMVIAFPTPVFCTTADREIHLTTDAAISLDITVYGYEW